MQAAGSIAIINTLIEAGARVNEADRQGHTPLHLAAERGRGDVIKLLLAHGADTEAVEKVKPIIMTSSTHDVMMTS